MPVKKWTPLFEDPAAAGEALIKCKIWNIYQNRHSNNYQIDIKKYNSIVENIIGVRIGAGSK